MENVTNYTTSIAMFKAKSFQKEFQKEKKKVQFQIQSDKITKPKHKGFCLEIGAFESPIQVQFNFTER